jgi:hypothetical protein
MAASQKSMRSFFQTTEGPIKKTKVESSVIIGASITQVSASSSSSESGAEPTAPVASIFSTHKEVKVDSSSVAFYTPDGLKDDAWKSKLSKEFSKPYYKTLTDFVCKETEKGSVYPPNDKVFTAFNLCSFDNVKVRIMSSLFICFDKLFFIVIICYAKFYNILTNFKISFYFLIFRW